MDFTKDIAVRILKENVSPPTSSLVPSLTRFPTVHPLSYPAPCSLHSATVVSFVHSTPLRSVPQGRGDRGTKEPSTEGAGRGVEG